MASQLTLDASENPDLAAAIADCPPGRDCQFLITISPADKTARKLQADIIAAEYVAVVEDDELEEEAPPPRRRSRSNVAPAVGRIASEMA